MKLILLSGNHKSNIEWIEKVHSQVGDLFDSAEILYYQHWKFEDSDQSDIDLDLEIKNLKLIIPEDENYIIFAKSAGSLLTLKAINENLINPKKVFIVGFPYSWGRLKGYEFESWLENISQPITFIQKTSDPAISYKELKTHLSNHKNLNYELIEVEGDSHYYENIEELKCIIAKYVI